MKKLFILLAVVAVSVVANAKDELLIIEEGSPLFWNEKGKMTTIDIDWSKTVVVEWGSKDKVKEDFGSVDQYNKMKGEDFVNDWPSVQYNVLVYASTYTNLFNKKGLKMITPLEPGMEEAMKLMTEEQKADLKKAHEKQEKNKLAPALYRDYSEASYDMFLSIDSVDMGNAGASAFAGLAGDALYRGGAEIVGTLEVRDHATQEIVCRMHVNHLKGRGSYSETTRLGNLFWRLADDAMPSLIKALNKKK